MNVQHIFLSTADAARLLGVSPAAMTKAARESDDGDFRGIPGRKGPDGNWSWPAAAVRALARPHSVETPNGVEWFVDLVAAVAPEVSAGAADVLGSYLLGSEATPGWTPEPGRFEPDRLKVEIGLAGLLMQAVIERVDQAEIQAGAPLVADALDWLVKVVGRSLRYCGSAEIGRATPTTLIVDAPSPPADGAA